MTVIFQLFQVLGACWYSLSIQRQDSCWRQECGNNTACNAAALYCGVDDNGKNAFLNATCQLINQTNNLPDPFFGIYAPAIKNVSQSRSFFVKLFFCVWWGLQNLRSVQNTAYVCIFVLFYIRCNSLGQKIALQHINVLKQDMDSLTFVCVSCYIQCSSLGQNLKTSTYAWENLFAVFVSISGLVLFALLIGNVQVNTFNTDSLEFPFSKLYLKEVCDSSIEIIKWHRFLGVETPLFVLIW